MSRPAWTTPPWTRAPFLLRREPSAAVAIAVSATLLGLACAALPLYLVSAASASVALQAKDVCPAQLGDDASGSGPVRGVPAALGSLGSTADRTLARAGAGRRGLAPAVVTMSRSGLVLSRPGIPASPVQLATSTGGLDHVAVVSSAGGTGVWLSDDVASAFRVRPGQEVSLAGGGPATRVRVAGIYRDLVGTSLPEFWCTQTAIFGLPDSNAPPPPVVLTDRATFLRALSATGVRTVTYLDFQRFFTGHSTLPQARRVAAGATAFTRAVGEATIRGPEGPPTGHRSAGGFTLAASPPVRLTALVSDAAAVENSLRGSVAPVSVAAVIIAALLVGLAGSYWVDRRRIELGLLSVRGVGPVALGVKGALESVVPVVLGVLLGWGLSLVVVPWLGPSRLLTSTARLEALGLSAIGAAVGLLLVAGVAAARSRGLLERPVGHRAPRWTRIPFELVGLAGALWAWRSLGQVGVQPAGNAVSHVPASFLVFPLLFVLSLAIFAGRVLAAVLGSGLPNKVTRESPPAVWLAVRRLSGGPQIAALLMLSATASLAILMYSSALTRSQQSTLYAKAEVFVGSDVSAQIAGPVRVPPELARSATIVTTSTAGNVGPATVKILAVNPRTFAQGAYWNSALSDHSLADLLRRLSDARGDAHNLPVIESGSAVGLPGGLSFVAAPQAGTVNLHVVATTPTFPGQNGTGPLLVTTQADFARIPIVATTVLWSHGTEPAVLNDLARAGDVVPVVVSRHDVVGATAFAAIAWTFAYLQSLGVLAGLATAGGLLLFLSTRARARGLAYVLARRMGLSRAAHARSLALEVAVMLGLGGLAGAAVGWLAVELAARHLNELPDLAPPPLLVAPFAVLAGATAAIAVTWLVAVAWAQHAADRARPAELLRLDA